MRNFTLVFAFTKRPKFKRIEHFTSKVSSACERIYLISSFIADKFHQRMKFLMRSGIVIKSIDIRLKTMHQVVFDDKCIDRNAYSCYQTQKLLIHILIKKVSSSSYKSFLTRINKKCQQTYDFFQKLGTMKHVITENVLFTLKKKHASFSNIVSRQDVNLHIEVKSKLSVVQCVLYNCWIF